MSTSLEITKSSNAKFSPLGGLDSFCSAVSKIQSGSSKSLLFIGTQECLTAEYLNKVETLGILNTKDNGNPQESIRSFDIDAKGIVLGEGAAAIVLEELESALARNAKILAEVKGFARNNDGQYLLKPAESGLGLEICCKQALKASKVNVEVVLADGTSQPERDLVEVKAICSSIKKPKITGIKGNVGHLMGALGSTQIAASVLAVTNVFFI